MNGKEYRKQKYGRKSARQIMNEQVSEKQFQANVIELAQRLGWKVAHFRSVRTQRKDGSTHYATPVAADGEGFPDLVMARPLRNIIYAELKAEKGKFSMKQMEWMEVLIRTHSCEVYAWRPSDWDTIQEILE